VLAGQGHAIASFEIVAVADIYCALAAVSEGGHTQAQAMVRRIAYADQLPV
jgi:hypothetical protein